MAQPFEKPTCRALAGFRLKYAKGSARAAGREWRGQIDTAADIGDVAAANARGGAGGRIQYCWRIARSAAQAGISRGHRQRILCAIDGAAKSSLFRTIEPAFAARLGKTHRETGAQFRLTNRWIARYARFPPARCRRLSLARALLHAPPVMLLDEPTRSLDAIGAMEFRRFLKIEVLQRGQTSLLFASHTLAEIELLADRVAIIDSGRAAGLRYS